MSSLLIIVPSRGRPASAARLVEACAATCTGDSRLYFCLDSDDPTLSQYAGAWATVGPRQGLVGWTNQAACEMGVQFDAVGSIGDDHLPRTHGWDSRVLAALDELGTGIVYGDDGFQGEALPTACFMTSDIVAALGYMAPPELRHMYCDNVWLEWGRAIDRIRYLPDVVIEHMHPAAGKGEDDDSYRESGGLMDADHAAFDNYVASHMAEDVERLRRLL